MTTYAAFLRGINVGGRLVKMADLKTCLTDAGLHNVVTLLQSGNVIFESNASQIELKRQVETALTETFRYPAKAQILPIETLRQVVVDYPFGVAADDQHDYVVFMENGLEKTLAAEPYSLAPGEQVQAGNGVVYWRVGKGSTLKSSFAKQLTKTKYRDYNTNRNIKTLQRLLSM